MTLASYLTSLYFISLFYKTRRGISKFCLHRMLCKSYTFLSVNIKLRFKTREWKKIKRRVPRFLIILSLLFFAYNFLCFARMSILRSSKNKVAKYLCALRQGTQVPWTSVSSFLKNEITLLELSE